MDKTILSYTLPCGDHWRIVAIEMGRGELQVYEPPTDSWETVDKLSALTMIAIERTIGGLVVKGGA